MGNVFIKGSTSSYGAENNDAFLLKYDSSGNFLWYKTWGGSKKDNGKGITLDSSGNVFITGQTRIYGTENDDVILLKYVSSDTDGDGLSDSDEINTYGTDPIDSDTDGDDLSDSDEIDTYGTDPNDSDTDGDGLPDGWEVLNSLNPLLDDSASDPDSDNLINSDEFTNSADPNDADTDNDGLSDNDEVNIYDTDPNNSDTDGDGLSDDDEVNTYDTNPNNSDTDGDGLSE